MPFNPFTLAFARQWADLEAGFLDFYHSESLLRIRTAILVAVFFYAVFGILDYVMVPDKTPLFWMIRYLIVIPFALWVFFLSFRPRFKERAHPLLFAMCLIGGLGIECMIILADPPATYSYYAGLILIFITIHTFLSMRFLWATACSWTIVIFYEIAAVWIADTPVTMLVNNNFFFISAVIICMMAGYTMEINARYRYLSAHLLAREKDKVSRINQSLDNLVRERTLALSRTNERLKQEIKEREATQTREFKLEKALNKRQKMEAIGTLAGGIAHDFNNILSAVIGYTELALDEKDDATRMDHHTQVLNAAFRAKDLVSQILAFSRQADQDIGPVMIQPLVKEALKLLRASIPAGIEMNSRLASAGTVMGNPTQIHRIIMNVCTNAFHAMSDHRGVLDIVLEDVTLDALFDTNNRDGLKPGVYVRLSISDTGHGMTPDIIDKIFDPFFTTKDVDQGTGMGLSVVHGIIEQYGGSIRVYSEPGKGSTFTILLPAADETAASEKESAAPVPGGTESILVLDDEAPLAAMLEKALSALGYRVASFTDPREALAHLKEGIHLPDLIITDYTMPKMNGIEFAGHVNAGTGIPVILCTGYSETLTREKMTPGNIRGYLMKPLIRRTMAETIRQVLDPKGS